MFNDICLKSLLTIKKKTLSCTQYILWGYVFDPLPFKMALNIKPSCAETWTMLYNIHDYEHSDCVW